MDVSGDGVVRSGEPKFKPSQFNIAVPLKSGRSLLFNSLTESMAVLDRDESKLVSDLGDASFTPATYATEAFIKSLAAGGFIVRNERGETSWVADRFESKRNNDGHLGITIATTLGCNLACGYCFQGQQKSHKKLTEAARSGLIKYVTRRISELKSLNITWYGGEPLMNAAEIWTTSGTLKTLCIDHSVPYNSHIITNGYLLTAAVASKLYEHGVTYAQVTLDGTQVSHDRMRPHISGRGSFGRVMGNIEDVVMNSRLALGLRISLDAQNADDVKTLLFLLAEKGLGGRPNLSVYFAPVEAISEGCADYEALSLSKRSYAEMEIDLIDCAVRLGLMRHTRFGQDRSLCQAVRPGDLVIVPNGDLHKCWDTVSFERMKIANITEDDFEEKLRGNEWVDWRATANPICASCKILPICGGGCAFKSVHPDEQSGEAASLPCISLKFNLAERLFRVAVASGAVREDEWDPQVSPTIVNGSFKTGQPHSMNSKMYVAGRIGE